MMPANEGSDVLSQLERFKESFLWAAAKGGRVEECESLVQMGTDVNWISPEGDTPLLAACRNGHVPAALYLLSHGASVNQAAKDGQTALHLSCRHGKEAVAEALILRGADVFARDSGGATALESQGPHAPDGMLRRLNTVALRSSRRNHHDDGVSIEPNATSNVTSGTSGSADGEGQTSNRRHNNNSIYDAETLRNPTSGGGRFRSNECIRPGLRRGSTGHHQEYHRTMGNAHDSAGGVGLAAISTGHGESDAQWRGGSRTTFPSISRAASSNTGSRQSSTFNGSVSRVGSSGGEGFHSSDDDELLYEDETRIRLLGGVYRGSGSRRQGSLSLRNRSRGSDGFPQSMQLISAGDPVPHASAAIAAAIASAAAPGPPTSTTANTTISSAFSRTASDTAEVTAPPSQSHQQQSFDDFAGTNTAPWDGAGADGGGGHGIVVSHSSSSSSNNSRDNGSSSSSSSSSNSSSNSNSNSNSNISRNRGSSRIIGSRHGSGSSRSGGSDDGQNQSGVPAAAAAAAAAAITTATTTSISTTTGVYGSLAANEATGGLARGHGQQWAGAGGRGGGGYSSGDTAYIPSGSSREGTGGGSGHDGGIVEGNHASDDHVGLIRALWLEEKESRLASEAKAEAVRDQSARLWNELVRSEKQVLSLEEGMASLREERDKLKATLSGDGFKGRSLPELEQLEKDLRKALDGVCGERDRIVQEQLAKEEQRLCVVCQENERGVLLLPCRHLCVCRGCSERPELTQCPLCRDHIAESLVVYS